MELLDLPVELIILIEERLPTKADASAFMRTHPCLLQMLQKRLYSRAKSSEVDLNLRWACKMGNEGLAFAMLRMGANVLLSVHEPVPLSITAIHGQLNMVEFLVKHDPKIINETSDNTCTPIMGATIKGHMEIVKFLLAQPGLDPQKQSSYFNYDRIHQLELGKKLSEYVTHKTPIDQALYDGNWELVQILLADIRVELSALSLTAAARGGNEDLIRLCLLRYPQTFDPAQESLPIIATRKQRHGSVKLLLEAAGHISETEWAPGGTTSFVSAAIQDTPSPDKSLLARNNINFNTIDECGRSPLFYCLYNGSMGMMKMLLDTGEVDVDCTYQGRSTLSYAAEVGEGPVNLLLSLDAGILHRRILTAGFPFITLHCVVMWQCF